MSTKGGDNVKDYYSVTEYSKIVNKDPGNIRRKLLSGEIKGTKIGNQWVIPVGTAYPEDRRLKSGKYRNWRNAYALYRTNENLIKALKRMCREISGIYGEELLSIVLYGSYARGEQSAESDVDIAVFLKKDDTNTIQHDAMTDVVVDYELENSITLSVITVRYDNYIEWKDTLPFYKNIDKEGIVLWRAA